MSEFSGWLREVFRGAMVDAIARGFRVHGISAERRHHETVQLIGFQAAKGNTANGGDFFVNVSVNFDAFNKRRTVPHEVDWSARLEELAPDVPKRHSIVRSTDRAILADALRAPVGTALHALDRIDSVRGMLAVTSALPNFPAMDGGFQLEDRAVWKHAAGDLEGALDDLIELKRTFPDRVDIRELAQRHELHGLDFERGDRESDGLPRSEENRELREMDPPQPKEEPVEERVVHPVHGEGVVLARDGRGPSSIIQVQFPNGVHEVVQRTVVKTGAPKVPRR